MRGIVVSGKVKLFVGVLLLQLGYAGLTVVSAITVNMGISKLVFLTYRSAIAFAFLAPFAYFLEKYVLYKYMCIYMGFVDHRPLNMNFVCSLIPGMTGRLSHSLWWFSSLVLHSLGE